MTALSAIEFSAGAGNVPGFFMPEGQAEGHRLVKGTKSPTRLLAKVQHLINNHGEIIKTHVQRDFNNQPGTRAVLSYREWCDTWRLTCRGDNQSKMAPPEHAGERITNNLSNRGATAIGEACEFVTEKFGGFSTFMTLTLSEEVRRMLEIPKAEKAGTGRTDEGAKFTAIRWGKQTSIQREVSRLMDGLGKMYQRGWVAPYQRGTETKGANSYTPIEWNRAGVKTGGRDYGPVDRLHYVWVAENPLNDEGKQLAGLLKCETLTESEREEIEQQLQQFRNPHIHLLIRWRVPWSVFTCWAHRIESLWGQGFAHIEKLKAAEAAGYYMAKAAGYLSKGVDGDQGPIIGNRYGMSAASRAPGWVPALVMAWGVLGTLLDEAKEIWKEKRAPLAAERDRLSDQLKATPKAEGKKRQRLGALLMNARQKIKDHCPAWFGKLCGTFRGNSIERFFQWAERRGFDHSHFSPPPNWFVHSLRVASQKRREWRELRGRVFDDWAMAELLRDARRWEPVEREPVYFEY